MRQFISFLGTGLYQPVTYMGDDRNVVFVQESLIRTKMGEICPDDRITVFVTESAMKKNYLDCDCRKGLKNCILEGTDVKNNQLEKIDIPDGKNEKELMEVFSKIYDTIEPGEELILDVTHSFRSLPMLLLSVVVFAETVKKIKLNGIYYGAYEAKEKKDGVDIAPVFDLTTFIDIIRWSQAAADFDRFGNSDNLHELCAEYQKQADEKKDKEGGLISSNKMKLINPIIDNMNDLTRGLETSRGYYGDGAETDNSIYAAYRECSKHLKDYKSNIGDEEAALFETPLEKLIDIIGDKISLFEVKEDSSRAMVNLNTGLKAVKWAIDNKKTQQGFTALEETLKTSLCLKYGLDEKSRINREDVCKSAVNAIPKAIIRYKNEMKKKNEKYEKNKEYEDTIRRNAYKIWVDYVTGEGDYDADKMKKAEDIIMTIPFKYVSLIDLVSNARNSINHFGYSGEEVPAGNLEEKLEKSYERLNEIIEEMDLVQES